MSGLVASDLMLTRVGADLFIKINSSGETLKVQGQFTGNGATSADEGRPCRRMPAACGAGIHPIASLCA
jgi:hypothetical protein